MDTSPRHIGPVGHTAAHAEGTAQRYDVLVLDAAFKQSLAAIRSLGRAGLLVAAAESFAECDPKLPVAGFRSRYTRQNVVLPSYVIDARAYAEAIVNFVREHPTGVVLPTMDGSISSLTPVRQRLAEFGCVLALPSDHALDVANDKDRTLELADRLGIAYPRTLRVDSVDELPTLLAAFDFPFVLKPTMSWPAQSAERLAPVEVVDKEEAEVAVGRYLAAGAGALAQEWASGRREGVTLFLVQGELLASCAHATLRTTPALGGASVVRQSIPLPVDIFESAVRLARAMGLDGVCEVEFRRDKNGRPLLMEVNARLAGTIKNALHSGVDFPLMIWQWAAGQPISTVHRYKNGVRTRWLRGDVRWLRDNSHRVGRPDSVRKATAAWMFASEFARTRHYDSVDRRDLGPAIGEIQTMVTALRKVRRSDSRPYPSQSQGAQHVS